MKIIFNSLVELQDFIDVFVRTDKTKEKLSKDHKLKDFHFNTRVMHALQRCGIKNVGQLIDLSRGEEVEIHGRGGRVYVVNSIEELSRYVKGVGVGTTDYIRRVLKTIC